MKQGLRGCILIEQLKGSHQSIPSAAHLNLSNPFNHASLNF